MIKRKVNNNLKKMKRCCLVASKTDHKHQLKTEKHCIWLTKQPEKYIKKTEKKRKLTHEMENSKDFYRASHTRAEEFKK